MKIKQILTSTRCHFMLLTLLNRTKYFAEVVIVYVEQAVHTRYVNVLHFSSASHVYLSSSLLGYRT